MVFMQGASTIYFSYTVALWASSTSCDGSASTSLHLGVPVNMGFLESKLLPCVNDQLGSFPGDATLLLGENANELRGYTYSAYQCAAGKAPGVCTAGQFSTCTLLDTQKETKYGECVPLGAKGSFMFSRKVSQGFYAAVFVSIFVGIPLLVVAVLLRMGFRCENGRCARPSREGRLPVIKKAGGGADAAAAAGTTMAVNPTSVIVSGGAAPPATESL